ncbi:MAG: glycosyltransferase family 2 protein [Verrucomicrobia bacterium]|nr:glycosyltransferase family 2 protein [Verrucomicrobiota bacterium]
MSTPLISVCIAACNAEKYIEASLRTVETQTFKNWEIIVTEDGSSDRTEEHVRAFAPTVTQRIEYNRHDSKRGIPATRNTGIASAKGDWIALLDADDLWKPNHLESLISASHIEDGDAVYAGSILYDNATWDKLNTHAPTESDLTNLPIALYSGHLSIMSSAVMIKRASIAKYGPFSSDFPLCSNTEYWLRLLSKGGHMSYSGANTCIYRQHTAAPSRKTTDNLAENARICEHYASWDAITRRLSRERLAGLYRLTGFALMADNPAAARTVIKKSLQLQPLHAKSLCLWARAFVRQSTRRPRAA